MKLCRVVRPGTLEEVRGWILAVRPEGADVHLDSVYYVLVVEGRRVAAVALKRLSWYATEIRHLVVVPEERGKGYGRAAVRFVLEKVRTPLAVATARGDNAASRALFASEGFRDLAEIDEGKGPIHFFLKEVLRSQGGPPSPATGADQPRV